MRYSTTDFSIAITYLIHIYINFYKSIKSGTPPSCPSILIGLPNESTSYLSLSTNKQDENNLELLILIVYLSNFKSNWSQTPFLYILKSNPVILWFVFLCFSVKYFFKAISASFPLNIDT